MDTIKQNGMYFVDGIRDIVISAGGEFNDIKERPIVALLRSIENPDIFWAIPIGDVAHRNEEGSRRIQKYLDFPKGDIRSCFYHIGNTNKKTIFFISDVFPIIAQHVTREYLTYNAEHFVIKNKPLLIALDEKLRRILAYERDKSLKTNKFFFRQNIYGTYDKLKELLERPEAN